MKYHEHLTVFGHAQPSQKVIYMSAFDTHCEIEAPDRDLFVRMFAYTTGVKLSEEGANCMQRASQSLRLLASRLINDHSHSLLHPLE